MNFRSFHFFDVLNRRYGYIGYLEKQPSRFTMPCAMTVQKGAISQAISPSVERVHVLVYALHVSRVSDVSRINNTKARFSTAVVPKRTGWMEVYIRTHVNDEAFRSSGRS